MPYVWVPPHEEVLEELVAYRIYGSFALFHKLKSQVIISKENCVILRTTDPEDKTEFSEELYTKSRYNTYYNPSDIGDENKTWFRTEQAARDKVEELRTEELLKLNQQIQRVTDLPVIIKRGN